MENDKYGFIIWVLVLLIMCGGIGFVSYFVTPIPLVWIFSPLWETALMFLILIIGGLFKVLGSFMIDYFKSRKEKK